MTCGGDAGGHPNPDLDAPLLLLAAIDEVKKALASGDFPSEFMDLACQLVARIDAKEFDAEEPTLEEGMAWIALAAMGMATYEWVEDGVQWRLVRFTD